MRSRSLPQKTETVRSCSARRALAVSSHQPRMAAHLSTRGQNIADVASGLRSGAISPDELPIQYVARDGQNIAINNRSLLALRRAGLDPTVTVDVSGDAFAEARITNRLAEMGGQPSDTIRVRGAGPNASYFGLAIVVSPGRLRQALQLPFSTAESEDGPIVEHRPGRLTLRYDAEGEHGVVWTALRFAMVLAIRFTPDPACDAWMVEAYSSVCEFVDSAWLAALRSTAAIRGIVLSASARHFVIYFDHVGCWEVLADEIQLESADV